MEQYMNKFQNVLTDVIQTRSNDQQLSTSSPLSLSSSLPSQQEDDIQRNHHSHHENGQKLQGHDFENLPLHSLLESYPKLHTYENDPVDVGSYDDASFSKTNLEEQIETNKRIPKQTQEQNQRQHQVQQLDEAVLSLIRSDPSVCSVRNQHGLYPLHIAMIHEPTVSLPIIQELVSMFPDAAAATLPSSAIVSQQPYQQLPLHLALHQSNVRPEVVDLLLKAHPSAFNNALQKDVSSSLSSERAVAPSEARTSVNKKAEASKRQNETNSNSIQLHPLIIAFRKKVSPPVIQKLIEHEQQQQQQQEKKQETLPLHLAMENGATSKVIKFLLQLLGSVAAQQREPIYNQLPLHVGMRQRLESSSKTLQKTTVKNNKNSSTKTVTTKQKLQVLIAPLPPPMPSIESLKIVLQAYPKAVHIMDNFHSTPLFLAFSLEDEGGDIGGGDEEEEDQGGDNEIPSTKKKATLLDDILAVAGYQDPKIDSINSRSIQSNGSGDENNKNTADDYSHYYEGRVWNEFTPKGWHAEQNWNRLHMAMLKRAHPWKVQVLLNRDPSLARQTNSWGNYPLHEGVRTFAREASVIQVLEAYPDACTIPNMDGGYVIHYAMRERDIPITLVEKILSVFPQGAMIKSGYLEVSPLHLAIANNLGREKILTVLRSCPGATQLASAKGRTPLHECVTKNTPIEVTREVFAAFPQAAAIKDGNKNLPIQEGIKGGLPQDLLLAMLDAYPEAASPAVRTLSDGMTLLHLAMYHQSGLKFVTKLLDMYPKSASVLSKHNYSALSLGVGNHNVDVETIRLVLDAYPQAAKLFHKESGTPLHAGMRGGVNPDIIRLVIQAYPEALKMRDSRDQTPLHSGIFKLRNNTTTNNNYFIDNDSSSDVKKKNGGHHQQNNKEKQQQQQLRWGLENIHTVLNLYPQGAKMKDGRGFYPLFHFVEITMIKRHTEVLGCTSAITKTMELLYNANPAAAQALASLSAGGGSRFFSVGSPVNFLIGICAVTERLSGLFKREICKQLRILLQRTHDGRALRILCSLDNLTALQALFLVFDENYDENKNIVVNDEAGKDDTVHERQGRRKQFVPSKPLFHINLNRPVIAGWTFLEMLADFDTEASSSIVLQIVHEQRRKLDAAHKTIFAIHATMVANNNNGFDDEDDKTVDVPSNGKNMNDGKKDNDNDSGDDGDGDDSTHEGPPPLLEFVSVEKVSDLVKTRVADRAKLSNSSERFKQWGLEYGRFLRKYRLDGRPRHVSETCVVVFGTEAVEGYDGRSNEVAVALKFMCGEDTFRREIEKRKNTVTSDFVVPIKACYASNEVVLPNFDCPTVNIEEELEAYPEIRLRGDGPHRQANSQRSLDYLLVMDCGAGYDLHDYIGHQNVAGKDMLTAMVIAKEVAMCLQFLNESCSIIHGDVKARNFIARGVGLVGFSAIDLDNAAFIGKDVAGKKRTSSGYLPPEQALVEQSRRSRERGINDGNAGTGSSLESLMAQLNAATCRGDVAEVVRLARLCEKVAQPVADPDDVVASPQYDMWCFGALLYYLCTGNHLFNVDVREDVDDTDLSHIVDWTDATKEEKMSKIRTPWPRKLIETLLQKYPQDRPRSWKEIIDELNNVGTTSSTAMTKPKVLFDRLVVFQSAPLAFRNSITKTVVPIPVLDFKRETEMLQEALKDAEIVGAKIDVIFETASIDRFSAFFAQRMSRVIHFSGHGHPDYLAWEDEKGGLQTLSTESLTRFVSVGEGTLQVVFVSACHSELTGRAFIDAGVPHVVCCRLEERFRDVGAMEFARHFYRALACGHYLLKAFQLAQAAVRESPLVEESTIEADKFLLLPQTRDPSCHDIPVFFTETVPSLTSVVKPPIVKNIPRAVDGVVGRERFVYGVLNTLATCDIVRVHGVKGMGKSSVVAATCNYLLRRPRSFPLDYLFWLPPKERGGGDDRLYDNLCQLIDCHNDDNQNDRNRSSNDQEVWNEVVSALSDKSLYLVVDLRIEPRMKDKVTKLVSDLFQVSTIGRMKAIFLSEEEEHDGTDGDGHSPNQKVGHEEADGTSFSSPSLLLLREERVLMEQLDLGASISLFAHRIPSSVMKQLRTSPTQLQAHLMTNHQRRQQPRPGHEQYRYHHDRDHHNHSETYQSNHHVAHVSETRNHGHGKNNDIEDVKKVDNSNCHQENTGTTVVTSAAMTMTMQEKLYRRLGRGRPNSIIRFANSLTHQDLIELLEWWHRHENDNGYVERDHDGEVLV